MSDFIRISFSASEELIVNGVERLRRFCASL
jgi:hypothetical protein